MFSLVADLLCPQPSRESPQETGGPRDWLYGALLHRLQTAPLGPDRPGDRSGDALPQGGAGPSQMTSEFYSQPPRRVH